MKLKRARGSRQATAVQTVLVNFAYFMYALPEGIAIAAGARVGNALGAGKVIAAKRAAVVAISLALVTSVIMVVPLVVARDGTWSVYFLEEAESVHLVAECTPPLILFLIFNSGYGALSGILLGSGKQRIGFIANLVACYLIGIPLGLFLAFPMRKGILGLWWGQVSGVVLLFCGLALHLFNTDWEQVAREVATKAQEGDEDLSEQEAAALAAIEESLGRADGGETGAGGGTGAEMRILGPSVLPGAKKA